MQKMLWYSLVVNSYKKPVKSLKNNIKQTIQGVAKNIYPLRFFAVFLSNCLEFQSETLPTY